MVRRLGRTARGGRAFVYHHHPLGRGQSASLIASFSLKRFQTVTVINTRDETVNTDKFMEVIENEILTDCNPYPGDRSVLVLDNASIHNKNRVREVCAAKGVLVVWLPPYSPDFNPIELWFNCVRYQMEAHYGRLDSVLPLSFQLREATFEQLLPKTRATCLIIAAFESLTPKFNGPIVDIF